MTSKQTGIRTRANIDATEELLSKSSQVGCEYEGELIPPGRCFKDKNNKSMVCRINTMMNVISYMLIENTAPDVSCLGKINCTAHAYSPTDGYPCCSGVSIGGKCTGECTHILDNSEELGPGGFNIIKFKELENPLKSGICRPISKNEGIYCPDDFLAEKLSLVKCQQSEAKAAQIQNSYSKVVAETFYCEKVGCQPMSSFIWDDSDTKDYTPNYVLCDEANKNIKVVFDSQNYNQCVSGYSAFYFEPRVSPPLPTENDFKRCFSYDPGQTSPPGFCTFNTFCHAGEFLRRSLGSDGNYESNPQNPCPAKKSQCIADHYPVSTKFPCCTGQSYEGDSLSLCGIQPSPTPMPSA